MAYTLKNTGPAASAMVVVAVDEDGAIKAWTTPGSGATWTSGSGLTIDAAVTTGTASFRSAGTRSYFETSNTVSVPKGIAFTTNPRLTARASDTDGFAGVAVMAGANWDISSGTNNIIFHLQRQDATTASTSDSVRADNTNSRNEIFLSASRAVTNSQPTWDNTVPFTLGWNYLNSGSYTPPGYSSLSAGGQMYQCLASTTTSSFENAAAGAGFEYTAAYMFTGVGGSFQPDTHATTPGAASSGATPGKYHVWAVFSRMLAAEEFQLIHDDWFGTLFASSGASAVPSIARMYSMLRSA